MFLPFGFNFGHMTTVETSVPVKPVCQLMNGAVSTWCQLQGMTCRCQIQKANSIPTWGTSDTHCVGYIPNSRFKSGGGWGGAG